MLDPTSRYYDLESATLRVAKADGTEKLVVYKRRRFLPPPGGVATLTRHTVKDGERVDNLAAVYVGDPTLYWRLCDTNLVFHPEELTAEPGRVFTVGLHLR